MLQLSPPRHLQRVCSLCFNTAKIYGEAWKETLNLKENNKIRCKAQSWTKYKLFPVCFPFFFSCRLEVAGLYNMEQPSCSCLGWLASSVLSLHRCLTLCLVPSFVLSLVTYGFCSSLCILWQYLFYSSAAFILPAPSPPPKWKSKSWDLYYYFFFLI